MGFLDIAKDIGVLIQKTDNIDLVKKLIEVQRQVQAAETENRDLKEANRVLTETLNTRQRMEFRQNAYWDGNEGPFCSRCFDADRLAVRMLVGKGYSPKCPKCETVARDPDETPAIDQGAAFDVL